MIDGAMPMLTDPANTKPKTMEKPKTPPLESRQSEVWVHVLHKFQKVGEICLSNVHLSNHFSWPKGVRKSYPATVMFLQFFPKHFANLIPKMDRP